MATRRWTRAWLRVTCIVLAFLVACSATGRPRAADPSVLARARMDIHEGIPFLYLQGTDYEVGYQYGSLLGDRLRLAYDDWFAEMDRMVEAAIEGMPSVAKYIAPIFLGRQIKGAEKALPPDIREQLRGISDGSGIPMDQIVKAALLTDLGCSSVITIREGRLVHGRNFDSPQTPYHAHQVVVRYDIEGKIPYVNIGYMFLPFVITGFNDQGLAFSIDAAIYSRPSPSEGRDSFLKLNNVLATCSTLQEVDAFLEGYHIPMNHVLVYSSAREGKAVFYDFVGNEHGRTEVTDVAYLGNRMVSAAMRSYETIKASTHVREDTFALHLAAGVPDRAADLVDWTIDTLSLTESYGYESQAMLGFEQICNETTLQSAVFDLSDQAVYFAVAGRFAPLHQWLRYHYPTGEVTVYRPESPLLAQPENQEFLQSHQAMVSATVGKDDAALRALRDALTMTTTKAYWPLKLRYDISMKLEEYEQAEAAASQMVSNYPGIAECYDLLATALERMERTGEAAEICEQGLPAAQTADRFQARFHHVCASWHASQGQGAEAAEHARQALEHYSSYWKSADDQAIVDALEQIAGGAGS